MPPILVWGFEPGIYLMAERPPATRFIYDLPLTLDHPAHRWRAAWRQEFIAALDAHPPALVIVATQDITAVEKEDSWTQMQAFPAFAGWLQQHYTEETRIERFVIYRRAGWTGLTRSPAMTARPSSYAITSSAFQSSATR